MCVSRPELRRWNDYKVNIILSKNHDPYWNLALEEYLMDTATGRTPSLLFWRSKPSVIIGKNQNPWRECNLCAIRKYGACLARRLSGGGAVYHDRGNLNYAFILERTAYNEKRQFGVIQRALKGLGIETQIMNRNSLMAGDYKISGNAFCFRKESAMHHGTILVDSDLDRLRKYLVPEQYGIETHAIGSIKSEVINLRDLDSAISMEDVRNAVSNEFSRCYNVSRNDVSAENLVKSDIIESRRRHYLSDEWIYDHTPSFSITLMKSFKWGAMQLDFRVEKGRVIRSAVEGLSQLEAKAISETLTGCCFRGGELGSAAGSLKGSRYSDIREWLECL